MYAVIRTGGKQYRVREGDTIEVERLDVPVGSEVRFEDVLLLGLDDETRLGNPTVSGTAVLARVVESGRGPKVIVFKYKRRKKYRRTQGHRQAFSRLAIEKIVME